MRASLEVVDPVKFLDARLSKQMTRDELAEAAGVSRSMLHRYESNPPSRISARRASRIAEALGMPRHELFKVVE